MKLKSRIVCTAGLLLATLAAHAWWSPDWTVRKELKLNTTAAGVDLKSALTEPTVLVRLHQGNFPQFLNVRDGGADFRVMLGDDKTPLKYHVDRFDPIGQMAFLWVKLPVLNPQSTEEKLYLYFGNGAAVKADEPGQTYDVATAASFHFNEAQGLPVDSTAYATSVTAGEVFPNPASIIGAGVTLPGTQALAIADNGALAATAANGWTFSTWVRITAPTEAPAYLMDRQTPAGRASLLVNGANLVARYGDVEIAGGVPLTAGSWAHVAVSFGASEAKLFINGVQAGAAAITGVDMAGPISIGGGADGSGLLAADLDELKISTVARSPEWVLFEAAIQGERNDAIVTYGADEAADAAGEGEGEAHGGHFGTIFQFVFGSKEAIVEQVVIGVCAFMALVAMLVMFSKALFLSRARAASNRFLRAYGQLAIGGRGDDGIMALLDKEKRYGISPLFQVYCQALAEVRKRRASEKGVEPVGLDAKAMGSIRAAMDAVMVRQQQKMNALMVLLTIAISGGPFIGLFGTVVGVMVTFASIAASGDVNINAIAPGMAAALLATVAGLGVAIPALFGYNYLGSKVKELSADMHVYADELTARVVEEFGH
jgi:biopolymer transport protein ExbB